MYGNDVDLVRVSISYVCLSTRVIYDKNAVKEKYVKNEVNDYKSLICTIRKRNHSDINFIKQPSVTKNRRTISLSVVRIVSWFNTQNVTDTTLYEKMVFNNPRLRKGVVICNQHHQSSEQFEQICRWYHVFNKVKNSPFLAYLCEDIFKRAMPSFKIIARNCSNRQWTFTNFGLIITKKSGSVK